MVSDSYSSSAKRRVLEVLNKPDLAMLVSTYDIKADKRSAKSMLEALSSANNVTLTDIIQPLPLELLKMVCQSWGIDEHSTSAQTLRSRVLEVYESSPQTTLPFAEMTDTDIEAQSTYPTSGSDKLTVDALERHLWSAADILRGSIDSSDYKQYIFGLLFLKRLSDVFVEEAQKLIEDGEDEETAWEDPDEHQFFVPAAARWSSLTKISTNIGEAINKACLEIEAHNPTLEGVLRTDFNDEQRLGETKSRDNLLSRLIQHFSKISLGNHDLSEPDMLGRAYEYLIERFADDAGKKGGEFYTPSKVVELIVELLAPEPGMRICDPTCGSGGLLIQCAKYVQKKHSVDAGQLTLHGQEKNLGTWGIGKMNMVLHGLVDHRLEKGDIIRDPKLKDGDTLMAYDRVVANPPFSLDEWGIESAESDPFQRFRFGTPPKSKGDLAFVQHMVATLNKQGQLGVVMPHGVLFRGSSEGKIRQGMLNEDLFEAVIGLPPQLFYGTGIPASVLILSQNKAPERQGKVLFIDASQAFEAGSARNFLRDEDIQKIAKTFYTFEDVERYARVVELEEIQKNDGNLTISRYVDTAEEAKKIDVGEAVRKLRELEEARGEAEAVMNRFLRELGYGA